ncbi:MAG: M4 family metallopeptidase, partial [Clostridiales bacterium]|nr:M4 family metallopeptidase [Clostridiales bacterium]
MRSKRRRKLLMAGLFLMVPVMTACASMKDPKRLVIEVLTSVAGLSDDPTLPDFFLPGTDVDISVSGLDDAIMALNQVKGYYGFENAADVLSEGSVQDTELFTVYRFPEVYKGLNVIGHVVNVIVDHEGGILYFSGNYIDIKDLPVEPTISAETAIENRGIDSGDLGEYEAELCVWSSGGITSLVWKISYESGAYYLSASDGSLVNWFDVVFHYDETSLTDVNLMLTGQNPEDGPLCVSAVFDETDQNYYMIDRDKKIYVYENVLDSSEQYFLDSDLLVRSDSEDAMRPSAVDALYNFGRVFCFYDDVLSRYSFDNVGETRILIGLDTANNDRGDSFQYNACASADLDENRVYVYIGTVDMDILYDNAYYLSVCAHEYTHAIQEYVLGDVYYSAQGNSLNEGIADIMGVLCCADYNNGNMDWKMRHGLGAIRDLESPKGDCISTYKEYHDWLDSHDASTLISHTAYLMTKHDRYPITDYQTLASLWYHALYFMDPFSGFADCRAAVEQVAKIMIENGEMTKNQYRSVWDAFETTGIPER